MPPRKPNTKKTNKPNPKKTNNQRLSDEEIHKRVKEALSLGLRTSSDFQRYGLLSIYTLVLARIRDKTFKVKTFNEYLRKYHPEFSIPEEKPVKRITSYTSLKNNIPFSKNQILDMIHFIQKNKYLDQLFKKRERKPQDSITHRLSLLSDKELDTIIANFLKTNRLTSKDMRNNTYAQAVFYFLKTQIRNGKSFRGYGRWANYLREVHGISLLSDKVFRSRHKLTPKEIDFINSKRNDATNLIYAYMRKNNIFLPKDVLSDLIESLLETAARNYNPKEVKFSTYITKSFIGRFKTYLSKLYKNRTISIDQSKSNDFRLKSVLAAKPKPEIPENFIPNMQKFEKLFNEGKITDIEAIVLLARASGNTLQEIGDNLGQTSKQRIDQIEKKAKQKLGYLA